ncbi:enoyl-CoA hydratase-related protein [Desulfarculus baarsii]
MAQTRSEIRPDGVAFLIMDQPGRPVNTLAAELLDDIDQRLGELAADGRVLAIVLASAKASSFVAGADLKSLRQTKDPAQASAAVRQSGRVLDRLAALAKPVVAAVHGAVLGGGLGLALSCRRIVAAEGPGAAFGLPAVSLGFIPAGGITGRLVARVGLAAALPLLLEGRRLGPAQALELGLIDAVARPEELWESAASLALALAQGRLAPRPRRDQGLDLGLIQAARRQVLARGQENNAAPLAVLEGLELAATHGPQAARHREDELFGQLVASRPAQNLIWHFGALAAQQRLGPGPAARPIIRLGIVGAGPRAAQLAVAGLERWGLAVAAGDEAAAQELRQAVAQAVDKQAARGLVRNAQMHLGRLRAASDLAVLAGCDAVIVTRPSAPARLAQILAACAPGAVLLVCGPLPPADWPQAEAVVGFGLADDFARGPLVELCRGAAAPWALDTAVGLAKALGKAVAPSGPAEAPLVELLRAAQAAAPPADAALVLANLAARWLTAGWIAPAEVELLAVHCLGFAAWRGGPLHVADEMGLARVVARLEALAASHGETFAPAPPLRAMAAEGRAFFA